MKRKKLVLLMLVFLLTLSGCGHTQKTAPSSSAAAEEVTVEQMEETFDIPVVTVLMDLPNDDLGFRSDHLSKALEYLPGYGKTFTTYEEQIPPSGVERDNAITRIKTEIMAGKGPDLFLCTQDVYAISGWGYIDVDKDPFFTFPEKAMKNHLFLPLDDYIANAEYMEWDKFLPVLMETGRNEEGRQMIPLGYFFEALYVDKDKYGLEDLARPASWQEMVQSDNPAVQYAARCKSPNFVGRVMEPGADEPKITEEELLGYIQDYSDLLSVQGDYTELNKDETACIGELIRINLDEIQDYWDLSGDSTDYCIIPARNVNGGVTANISAFAAINRNARYPDLAFKIIDFMMSTENQQKSRFYSARVLGLPVHMDIGSEEYPMTAGGRPWYMSEDNFKEFCAARDEITEAKYLGPVDKAVQDINIDPGSLKSSVHEQYMLIKMLLAES